MSTPVLPSIIRGPGIISVGGYVYYFGQEGIKRTITRPTDPVKDDFYGIIKQTAKGGPMVDLTFTPTGMIRSLIKPFPYGPTNLVAGWYGGQSIMSGTVFIQTKAGEKILYARGGISKSPVLNLNPQKQVFGPMTVSAINNVNVQPDDAAVLKTISSTAFADTTFDDSLIVKDIYTATLGARATPFDAMGARDGFEVEMVYEIEDVMDGNIGIADKLLTSVEARVRFAPNNITEAQQDEIANWQGADAIKAGEDVSRGPGGTAEDLIIDSDFLTATLHNAGVVKAEGGYGVKLDRNGQIEFVSSLRFTTGVPQPILSLVVN